MKIIRWGILGTGFISKVLVKAIQEAPSNVVAAIGSRKIEIAKAFISDNNLREAKSYGHYQDVINDPNVDVIYIGLPNHLHLKWTTLAIKAKKHILCEKPFTINAIECQFVFDQLKKSSVFCMEALMYRCHPLIKSLTQLIEENRIGKIYAFDALFADKIFSFANPAAGGSILDLGCYPVSLILLLVNQLTNKTSELPVVINAVGVVDSKNNTDNYSSLQLQFDDQLVASITASNHFGLAAHFRILGEEGVIEIDNPWLIQSSAKIDITYYDGRPAECIPVEAEYSLYAYEVMEVANTIRSGAYESNAVSKASTLQTLKILDTWRSKINLTYDAEKKSMENEYDNKV